jgi:hypothetical protein
LTIATKTVERHGGKLWFEFTLGETYPVFRMPLKTREAMAFKMIEKGLCRIRKSRFGQENTGEVRHWYGICYTSQ